MAKSITTKYTLVQHSGWTEGRNAAFKQAVEEASVTLGEALKVEKAGGVVYDTYTEAYDAAYATNYPPEVKGLHPRAKGRFHPKIVIDYAPLFIPEKVEIKEKADA